MRLNHELLQIHDDADARRCLEAAKTSGLGYTDWAHENNVDARSLNAWRMTLRRCRKAEAKPSLRLIELVPPEQKPSRYVIRCGEVSVEVDDCFDDATLRRLLKVVTSC